MARHTIHQKAKRDWRIDIGAKHIAGERDHFAKRARFRADNTMWRVRQAISKRAVNATDGKLCQIFRAQAWIAVHVA